jgi:hypothetical protein
MVLAHEERRAWQPLDYESRLERGRWRRPRRSDHGPLRAAKAAGTRSPLRPTESPAFMTFPTIALVFSLARSGRALRPRSARGHSKLSGRKHAIASGPRGGVRIEAGDDAAMAEDERAPGKPGQMQTAAATKSESCRRARTRAGEFRFGPTELPEQQPLQSRGARRELLLDTASGLIIGVGRPWFGVCSSNVGTWCFGAPGAGRVARSPQTSSRTAPARNSGTRSAGCLPAPLVTGRFRIDCGGL